MTLTTANGALRYPPIKTPCGRTRNSSNIFPAALYRILPKTVKSDRLLVDHLDGLIFLADQARQLPPGRCVYLAHTFRRLGQAYQDAALAQREGWPVRLHITYN